ncbi:MAG: hypothetical protein RSE62_22955, partial [Citrobacter sp.]
EQSTFGLKINQGRHMVKRTEQRDNDVFRQRLAADKDYPGFKHAMTDKKWDVDKLPDDQLSSLLEQYKQSLAKNVEASSMANQMRQNYQLNAK